MWLEARAGLREAHDGVTGVEASGGDASSGQRRVGVQELAIGRGREFVERLRMALGCLDVVTRQCDLDERLSERAQPKTVAAGRVEAAPCDGLGEVEFTSREVCPSEYLA